MNRIAAVALGVLALAACSRVEAASAPIPTPNLPCSLPYGTDVTLVSPRPGSAVASNTSTLVVVASHDLPKTVTVVATDANGMVTTGALERTARPAGAARTTYEHPVYYRAAGVTLRAHRHYTVMLDDLAQNGCAPYVAVAGDARFSTD